MKFTLFGFAVVGLLQLTSAAPSKIVKRASASDAATLGYATQNGGTTGGSGGSSVTVTTLDALVSATADDTARIVYISGTISGDAVVKVGSNKSVLGKSSSAALEGIGLRVLDQTNVIIRNLKISKVLADTGDAIGIQASTNVWVDHVDLSSDMDHDKDYYDGLLDITHGCDWITVSNSYLHDHWKTSLVGHSDSNGDEDSGHLTVTYVYNYWQNLNSRTPSFRFGTGHIYNNYYESVNDGINTRDGAQLLVQNNVFSDVDKPLYSTDEGYAVASGNDFGDGENTALTGTISSVPYSYSLTATSSTKAYVVANAGAILSF